MPQGVCPVSCLAEVFNRAVDVDATCGLDICIVWSANIAGLLSSKVVNEYKEQERARNCPLWYAGFEGTPAGKFYFNPLNVDLLRIIFDHGIVLLKVPMYVTFPEESIDPNQDVGLIQFREGCLENIVIV